MSDLSVLSVAQKIEESTDRIVDSIDKLTAAILATGGNHDLRSSYKSDFIDAYRFLQDTKGDAE